MTTVAIIPARGQSKQLARKNVRLVDGLPLIVHTVKAALAVGGLDRTVVSTDDSVIAAISRRAGAEVPFLRPADLATDSAPTIDAVRHAVAELERDGSRIDLVLTLQPTSPFRSARHIEMALALQRSTKAESVVSVAMMDIPISVMGYLVDGDRYVAVAPDGDVRRQASPPAVRLTGGIYLTARRLLDEGRLVDDRPAALILDAVASIDVDTMDDLRMARRVARQRART